MFQNILTVFDLLQFYSIHYKVWHTSLLLIWPRMSVCQCATFDQFLPARSHFDSKRPEFFFRISKFTYAAFGPLFAFHCPLFFYEKQ